MDDYNKVSNDIYLHTFLEQSLLILNVFSIIYSLQVVSLIETSELFGSSIHLTPAKQFQNKKIRKTEGETDKRMNVSTNKQVMRGGKDRKRE